MKKRVNLQYLYWLYRTKLGNKIYIWYHKSFITSFMILNSRSGFNTHTHTHSIFDLFGKSCFMWFKHFLYLIINEARKSVKCSAVQCIAVQNSNVIYKKKNYLTKLGGFYSNFLCLTPSILCIKIRFGTSLNFKS